MKRNEQLKVNTIAERVFVNAVKELSGKHVVYLRLRTCQAWVYETKHYYILRSYDTIIACISKKTGYLFDLLRKVYGYTNTSAQHIAKFSHDYGLSSYGCEKRYVWRDIA